MDLGSRKFESKFTERFGFFVCCLLWPVPVYDTHRRLQALVKAGAMTLLDSRNLEDAFTLINRIRLQQQAAQIATGETPDNYCDPRQLSRLQRHHLKQAFRVVHQAEEIVKLRYRAGA